MSEEVTIAIIAPMEPSDFFDLLWEGVWEATFDISGFGVQVRDLATEGHDPEGQQRILAELLDAGVDAIAILPAHARSLNELIDRHVSRGTPVITFHSDAPESRRSAFVGPDPLQAGALAGEVLAKLMRGSGRFVSFPGPPERYHLARRYEGFQAEIGRHGGRLKEVACATGSHRLDLPAIIRQADGLYLGGEEILEVAEALERLGLRIPCVGFSGTERLQRFLRRGAVSAVIDESRYQQGYFAVQKAYEASLKKKQPSLSGVRIPSTVVFAANASEAIGDDTLNGAFEMLVRQRTEILQSYREKLEAANAMLRSLAATDPLTGLLNRRRFEEALEQEMTRARRYGVFSLLMIDLNLFKLINDTYGHQAGDEVLKAVAHVLQSSSRDTDTCARLGGDEFAVLLPQTDFDGAAALRDRILDRIGCTAVVVGDQQITVSLSIGVAAFTDSAATTAELLAAADAAMYRAKQASRAEIASPAVG